MLGTIARLCCRCACMAVVAALVQATPARADELADFHTAIELALDQYHFTMSVLETGSQEQTSAEVSRLRGAWQRIAERFGHRPAGLAGADDYGGTFMQVDMRLITLLLVIELGNRDAARAGLAEIGDFLTQWSANPAEPR
jgi:hypothetical protein